MFWTATQTTPSATSLSTWFVICRTILVVSVAASTHAMKMKQAYHPRELSAEKEWVCHGNKIFQGKKGKLNPDAYTKKLINRKEREENIEKYPDTKPDSEVIVFRSLDRQVSETCEVDADCNLCCPGDDCSVPLSAVKKHICQPAPNRENFFNLMLVRENSWYFKKGRDPPKPGDSNGECKLDAQCNLRCGGAGMGDPHIQSWRGEWFDFHGQCDLVFLHSSSFADGLGLDIHIRTTIRDTFSFIEAVAVKIGDDTLEVSGWGDYILNGVTTAEFPATISGYDITYNMVNKKKHTFDIEYAEGSLIRIKTVKDLVNIEMVEARDLQDSVGLMGHFATGKLVARDGITELGGNHNAFGKEWQVQPDEVKLFEEVDRYPQSPMMCQMPELSTTSRRRLGEGISRSAAEEACTHWPSAAQHLCVSDVIAMNDLDAADAGAW